MRPRSARTLRILMNMWPPFLGSGIRVRRIEPDWRAVDVEMKLRRWNSNYVGTHYGGSLYSVTDPFYMLMLMHNLGREYVVWDKAASIRFRRPGKGRVTASFRLSHETIDEIRAALTREDKVDRDFLVHVVDDEGTVVAEVVKQIHVSRRPTRSAVAASS